MACFGLVCTAPLYATDASPAGPSFCETRYEPIDLGTLDPFSDTVANELNNRGHVTGQSAGTAVLWSCEHGLENIGQSMAPSENLGVALNELDHVVLMVAPEYPRWNPDVFLWRRGESPILVARDVAMPVDSINNAGVITSSNAVWTESTGLTYVDIGVPILRSYFTRFGRLGGTYFEDATLQTRLFTWTRSEGVKTLGPPVEDDVFPTDINDRGDLLVEATSTDLRTSYIMSPKGQVVMLPLRPDARQLYARRVNLLREVIGWELTVEMQPNGTFARNFVWDSRRGFRSLDDVFEPVPGNPFDATAINDWGWIVGNRRDFNASLLVPVPAHSRRFENLNRLRGPQLCRALAEAKVHRLMCSVALH